MAAQDHFFKKGLLEAHRYKFRYPLATSYKIGNYYRRYDTDIYKWSRKLLPQTYNKLYLDNDEYTKRLVLADRNGDKTLKEAIGIDPHDAPDETAQTRDEIARDTEIERIYHEQHPLTEAQKHSIEQHQAENSASPKAPVNSLKVVEGKVTDPNNILKQVKYTPSAPINATRSNEAKYVPVAMPALTSLTPPTGNLFAESIAEPDLESIEYTEEAPEQIAEQIPDQTQYEPPTRRSYPRRLKKPPRLVQNLEKNLFKKLIANKIALAFIVIASFIGLPVIMNNGVLTSLLPPIDQSVGEAAAPPSVNIKFTKVQQGCTNAGTSTDPCITKNDDPITYLLTIENDDTSTFDLDVTDTIPAQTTIDLSANPGWTADSTNSQIIHWKTTVAPTLTSTTNLTIKPANDIYVQNIATATVTQVHSNQPPVSNSGGQDLAACKFPGPGGESLQGTPSLASRVNAIATKVGIPASVLMGVIRIERSDIFVTADEKYFDADYDARPNDGSPQVAYGVAQFTPQTFQAVFNIYKDDINSNFYSDNPKSQAVTTIQSQQSQTPSDSSFRITSVENSLIAAAYNILRIKVQTSGSESPWDQAAVAKVAQGYQGACAYQSNAGPAAAGNYCQDLAASVVACQNAAPPQPQPGPAPTGEVAFVTNMVSGIKVSCTNGSVHSNNSTCVESAQPAIDASAIHFLETSANSGPAYTLQCVGFAQASIHQQLPIYTAVQLSTQAVPGYNFIDKSTPPQPGDLAVWSGGGGGAGHVAYITKVNKDGSFTVAEANYCSDGSSNCGTVGIRDVGLGYQNDTLQLLGWLRKQ